MKAKDLVKLIKNRTSASADALYSISTHINEENLYLPKSFSYPPTIVKNIRKQIQTLEKLADVIDQIYQMEKSK